MRRFISPKFIAFAGVLGIAAGSVQVDQNISTTRRKPDLRSAILRKFMKEKECPAEDFAEVFVAEADQHGLDWRLLPSLAFVESGAGKTSKGNNLFGWDNGRSRYASINQAIHEVATSLSMARAYQGKSLRGKLASYNQNVDYAPLVMQVMYQIHPQARLLTAR